MASHRVPTHSLKNRPVSLDGKVSISPTKSTLEPTNYTSSLTLPYCCKLIEPSKILVVSYTIPFFIHFENQVKSEEGSSFLYAVNKVWSVEPQI